MLRTGASCGTSFPGMGGKKRRAPLGDVLHDGAGLEQRDLAVEEHGHLPKRLAREVGGSALLVLADLHDIVGDAGFFELGLVSSFRGADPGVTIARRAL